MRTLLRWSLLASVVVASLALTTEGAGAAPAVSVAPITAALAERSVTAVTHRRDFREPDEDDYDYDDDAPPPRSYNYYDPPPPAYRPYGYAPPSAYFDPPVVEWLPPPRPSSCGEFRYWDGERCADARRYPPYVGPRW